MKIDNSTSVRIVVVLCFLWLALLGWRKYVHNPIPPDLARNVINAHNGSRSSSGEEGVIAPKSTITQTDDPTIRNGPPVNLQSITVRKGIVIDGISVDVEIKRLDPPVHVGLDMDSKRLRDIDRIPELSGFARIKHPQLATLDEIKYWVCRDGQNKVTKQNLEYHAKDEREHPDRHDHWVRYLVFITQKDLKALYICFNFERSEPVGPLVVSPYLWEDARWKSWIGNVGYFKLHTKYFDLGEASRPQEFFKKIE